MFIYRVILLSTTFSGRWNHSYECCMNVVCHLYQSALHILFLLLWIHTNIHECIDMNSLMPVCMNHHTSFTSLFFHCHLHSCASLPSQHLCQMSLASCCIAWSLVKVTFSSLHSYTMHQTAFPFHFPPPSPLVTSFCSPNVIAVVYLISFPYHSTHPLPCPVGVCSDGVKRICTSCSFVSQLIVIVYFTHCFVYNICSYFSPVLWKLIN